MSAVTGTTNRPADHCYVTRSDPTRPGVTMTVTKASDKTEVECNNCGVTVMVHPMDATNFESGDAVCDECHEQRMIELLRECLNPDNDGVFGRPRALKELEREVGVPFEDYDGGIITDVDVEYGSGRGAEPNGRWVESITKVVEADCDECGHDRADQSFKANAGCEPMQFTTCRICGNGIQSDI